MPIRNVNELIDGKVLYSTDQTATVTQVCGEMQKRSIGALAVLEDGKLTGIISERDVVTRVIAAGRDPSATAVSDVMTPEPVTIEGEDTLFYALDQMKAGGFRHLPVVKDDEAVGMISMRDIPTDNQFLHQRFQDAQQTAPAYAVTSSSDKPLQRDEGFAGAEPPVACGLTHLISAS